MLPGIPLQSLSRHLQYFLFWNPISSNVVCCLLHLCTSSTLVSEEFFVPSHNAPKMSGIVSSKSWQIARRVLHVLLGARGSCIILDLPTELLLEIFSYLPLPSQACLALSSKRLHHLFGAVLGAEKLRFPGMPRNGCATYVVTEKYNLRMTLLTQLENKRWACCGRCQRLHPRREFPVHQLNESPWKRTCMVWAGIVDLCPCISLTCRDRTRIVEYLKAPESNKPSLNSINKGVLLKQPGEQYLLHQCTAYQNVQIEMRVSLTDSEQLTTYTRYQPPDYSRPCEYLDHTMPICCSRKWMNVWAARYRAGWSCDRCHAHVTNFSTSPVITVDVVRYLGRERWFAKSTAGHVERQWYNQCRSLGDYIPA